MATRKEISPDFPFESQWAEVLGANMHYVEEGTGDPIIFLHGNPTSSYLWRNIIPHLTPLGRCIAPDLIGFGKSDSPDGELRVFDHIRYVEEFIQALDLRNITLVVHDWGSAIGLRYATENPENVRGVAMMEAHLRPIPTWADFADDEQMIEIFKSFRTPEVGWQLIVEQNLFVEQLLPGAIKRPLADEELETYQVPFAEKKNRGHIWRLANDIPVEGQPGDTAELFGEYSGKLSESSVPKFLLWFDGGTIVKEGELAWAQETLPNLQTAKVGDSIHFVQEDDPHGIGEALAEWYRTLD